MTNSDIIEEYPWVNNLLPGLAYYASQSPVKYFRHGSVLVKSGKPVSYGFNKVSGGKTYHAEHSVIRSYLQKCGLVDYVTNIVIYGTYYTKKKHSVIRAPPNVKRILSKLDLIVVRWNGSKFCLSKPCKHCIELLKAMGIKRVFYTNDDGYIVKEKISTITSDHVCMMRRPIG